MAKVAVISWVFPKQSWNPQSIERICSSAEAVTDYFEAYYPDCEIKFRDEEYDNPHHETVYDWVKNRLEWDQLDSCLFKAIYTKADIDEEDRVRQMFMIQIRNIH